MARTWQRSVFAGEKDLLMSESECPIANCSANKRWPLAGFVDAGPCLNSDLIVVAWGGAGACVVG